MGASKEVEAWFEKYQNPVKDVVLEIREIVLTADARIEECIKWQAPTFTYKGNLASFFPKSKKHASLMFHTGARIPGKHVLLEGTGETGRLLKISTVAAAQKSKKELQKIVRAWCDWRDQEATNEKTKTTKPASMKRRQKTSKG